MFHLDMQNYISMTIGSINAANIQQNTNVYSKGGWSDTLLWMKLVWMLTKKTNFSCECINFLSKGRDKMNTNQKVNFNKNLHNSFSSRLVLFFSMYVNFSRLSTEWWCHIVASRNLKLL